MTFLTIAVVAGLIALSIATCHAKRISSKAMLLGALLLLIFLVWAYVVLALGDLSDHESLETVEQWPSPFLLAATGLGYFAAVASFSFLRKQD